MKRFLMFCFIICFLLFDGVAFPASQQTSQTDASVIITNARAYLNEATAVFWSDAKLLVWVNDGTMDIVVRTHCLEAIEIETLVSGTSSYALGDPFIKVRAVVYEIPPGLKRLNLEEFIALTRKTGVPKYWTLWEDNILIHPVPTAAQAGKTIDVYTVKRPGVVVSSDDVLVPACYDRALTLYVAAQGFYADSQFTKASRFMAEYLAELDRFRMDFVTGPKEPIAQ